MKSRDAAGRDYLVVAGAVGAGAVFAGAGAVLDGGGAMPVVALPVVAGGTLAAVWVRQPPDQAMAPMITTMTITTSPAIQPPLGPPGRRGAGLGLYVVTIAVSRPVAYAPGQRERQRMGSERKR
jgi:hypothetical protein